MSSRTGSVNGAIDQFVTRLPKDVPATIARPQNVEPRARHTAYPESSTFRGAPTGAKPDREALAVAEHALADVSTTLDARYGGPEAGPAAIGARMGAFMSAHQVIDAVLGLGSSVGNDREVLSNLRDKLHLSAGDAHALVDILSADSHAGAPAEALRARAALVAQNPAKLANVRRVTDTQLATLKSLGHDKEPLVAGSTAIVAAFRDLIGEPRRA